MLVAVNVTGLGAWFTSSSLVGTLVTLAILATGGAVFAHLLAVRRALDRDRRAGDAFVHRFFAEGIHDRGSLDRTLGDHANISIARRCAALLEALHTNPGHDTSASIDRDRQDAAGVTAFSRFGIWALPILGFIGTVVGISDAIGAFSSAIDGIGDPATTASALKDHLPRVTSHLATAFDTTLWGLLFCLPAAYLLAMTERAIERHLSAVDEAWAVRVAPTLLQGTTSAAVARDSEAAQVSREIHELSAHIQMLHLIVHDYHVAHAAAAEQTP